MQSLLSAIKSAGYGTDAEFFGVNRNIQDLDVQDIIESTNPDLVLYRLTNSISDLEKTCIQINNTGKRMPIIAISTSEAKQDDEKAKLPSVVECMQAGASDRVSLDDTEHFKLVISRSMQAHFEQVRGLAIKQELLDTVQRSNILMDSSKDAIAYLHGGMHIRINDAYQELFGLEEKNDSDSMPLMDLIATAEQANFKKFLREYENTQNPVKKSTTTLIQAANNVEMRRTIDLCPAKIDGEDCTQLVIRMENMQSLATTNITSQTDFLVEHEISSGLYNRRKILEGIELAIEKASNEQKPYGLVLMQIDDYDNHQKALGVLGADQLFVQIGDLLMDKVPTQINVGRYNTSTFGFLVPSDKKEEVVKIATMLNNSVATEVFEIDGKTASCSMSTGAVIIYGNGSDAHEVISRALRSVEKAAEVGNQVEIYEPESGEKSQKLVDDEWGKTLKMALKDDRLKLVFQPIDCIKEDNLRRFTVFVRLHTENRKLVKAAQFMPSIERLGLAKGLDRWVLLKSLKVLSQNNQKDNNTVFFIKLTSGTLQQPDEFNWYREQILAHNLKPSQLVFEMRSDTVNDYIKTAKMFSETVRPMGCKIAIDGLSSGVEPFKMFKHIDADFIKIGLAYVLDLNNNKENKDAIKNIAHEATQRGQELIVTQIENAEQLTTLYTLNVQYVQGNFLHPPDEKLNYLFSN